MKDTSGSAFPNETPVEFLQVKGKPKTLQPIKWKFQGGLTKREWFAGMALQGILAGGYGVVVNKETSMAHDNIAIGSYMYADAMLEAGKDESK